MITFTRSRTFVAFETGAIAMLVALLATVIWRSFGGPPTLAERLADHLVVLIPGNLFELGIQTFGSLAKRLLFVALGIAQVGVGGILAVVVDWREDPGQRSPGEVASTFVRSALAALVVVGLLVAVAEAPSDVVDAAASLLATAAIFGVITAAARWIGERPVVHQGGDNARTVWYPTAPRLDRRAALYATAAIATGATGLAIARTTSGSEPSTSDELASAGSTSVPTRANTQSTVAVGSTPTAAPSATPAPSTPEPTEAAVATPTAPLEPTATRAAPTASPSPPTPQPATQPTAQPTSPPAAQPTRASSPTPRPAPRVEVAFKAPPGEVPEITPTNDFYKVSKNLFSDPRVDGSKWSLSVDGLVGKPMTLSISDLMGLKSIEKAHTLTCISNEVGGDLINNAMWKGARLADLLREAGIRPGSQKVVFHAADGYADSISVERAMDPNTLLAYEMNGATLPTGHGYPLRVLVPNIYGMKSVKWLTKIEVVNSDFRGYWQRGGWSDSAVIKTMSRIDVVRGSKLGQPVTVSGIAFAGARGISGMQVSRDGGKTWQDARVKTPGVPNVWTLWLAQFTPTERGSTRLLVRAVDGTGQVQTADSAPPFPDGSSGYHSVEVRVS